MLRPAQLYETELQEENIKAWYRPENIYWEGGMGNDTLELPKHNYDRHCFVSVDEDDNIVGYISYSVDWTSMSADKFGIIAYRRNNLTFGRDLFKAVCDLFEVYHMNRIQWCAYEDNPATKAYHNFIKNHGGRECGHYRQAVKLQDGKLHDSVSFEILAAEFVKKWKEERE